MWQLVTLLFFLCSTQLSAQSAYPSELIVAQDGSGNYSTIQEAVNATRDLGRKTVTIRIRKGIYKEKLVIASWKTHLTLIGEDNGETIITGDDHTGKPIPNDQRLSGVTTYNTYTSYTVLVEGDDIRIENLTIRNTAGRVGQAVALHVEGDRFLAVNCRLLSNQDTLYTATEQSRQYYKNCYIEGTTDFIFGEALCVFERCTIKSLTNSYITAAAHRENTRFGYVFLDCQLIADPEAQKVYLGRPWRPTAKTVFIRCQLGNHIVPEGWHPWPGDAMFPDKYKTAFYAEFDNKGPGANTAKRVNWSKQLTTKESLTYTPVKILGDWAVVKH